jgi:Domain of unknown function (DUF4278)
MFLTFPRQKHDAPAAELISVEPDQIFQGQTPRILTYRGIEYDATQAEIPQVSSERMGMYRGVRFKYLNIPAIPSSVRFMTYRGVSYSR